MLSQLFQHDVTIVHRATSGTVDDYGNEQVDETTTTVKGELQQRQRLEPGDQGETSSTEWVLFLPSGTDLDTSDVVDVDGLRFEVVGDPWDARTGSPDMWHLEATLKRVAGAEARS